MEKLSNFFSVPRNILSTEEFMKLNHSYKWLFVIMCHVANYYGHSTEWVFRSLKTLSTDSGLNIKTVFKGKKKLYELGFIDLKKGEYIKGRRCPDFFKIKCWEYFSENKNRYLVDPPKQGSGW